MATKKAQAPKRRRSSKRSPTKPVTLEVLAKMVDSDLASARVKNSQPVLQLTVPTKPQKEGLWFTVAAHDAGEAVYLRLSSAISVPKDNLNEALKLLRRLHELK